MGRPVVHWELMSKDPARVAAFYEKIFDWKVQHLPAMNYRIVETASELGINGGILQPEREGPWPGNMLFYIAVDDLAEYRQRIVAAGGKIHVEEQQVPGMGAFSLFTDPEGRMMGLWKSEGFMISRVFDAPRERLWRAWTEPGELKQWWGPKGFKVHHCTVELRPGGMFHYGMRMPDGGEMWGRFIYREIAAPERLVFVVSFSDPKAGVTRNPWQPNWPLETLSTVSFADLGGRTRLSVHWIPAASASELERKTFDEGRPGMTQGWTGTLDQFAAYLAKP